VGLTLAICIGVITFQAISVHLVPHATDEGISATAAAVALGLIGGFSIPGRLASGFISDRIGWQRMLALAFFGMSLSLLWLLFMQTQWMLYLFALCYGVFHGFRIPAQVGILSSLFGTYSVGELIGITTAVAQLVGAFAPYAAGFIFDRTGSYSAVFIILIVLLLVGGLVASMIKKPAVRAK
jgi:MFS family permease